MGTTRRVVMISATVTLAGGLVAAGFFIWTRGSTQPARWVVSDAGDRQKRLTIEWVGPFPYCAHAPTIDVAEDRTRVRLHTLYRKPRSASCGLGRRQHFAPAIVHLKRPLAGRSIVGAGRAGLSEVVASPLRQPFVMPGLIGMDAGTARRALSRVRFLERELPAAGAAGYVVQQYPPPGTRLRLDSDGVFGLHVAEPKPRLEFGS